MTDILSRTIDLQCSCAHAFRVFTTTTDLWWPPGHRKNSQSTIILEPSAGGRLFERNPDGSEWTVGEVLIATPPDLLEFNWFPGSPTAPTHVRVDFEDREVFSRIHITHRAISAGAQQIWPDRVAFFEKGWDSILPAFKSVAEISDNS